MANYARQIRGILIWYPTKISRGILGLTSSFNTLNILSQPNNMLASESVYLLLFYL